jgi:hypothetical protein
VKSGRTVIVIVTGAEWLRLPLVPTTLTVATAAKVPESTLTVTVDVTLPPDGGVTLAGENETCTPPGSTPVVLSATAELKPPIEVTVAVSVTDPPAATLTPGVLSASEKSAPGVTTNVKAAVWVAEPPVPLTVIG